ncbi:MAG: hypothetical protein H0X26_05595 [Alphaproteobacteria bacterium]|nr:hypothetical protein [Alphaproteobacteria bacterium]
MKKYRFYILIGAILCSGGQAIACLNSYPNCFLKNQWDGPVGSLGEEKVGFCQLPHTTFCYPCEFKGDKERGNAACTAAVPAYAGGGCVLGETPF